MDKIGGIGMSSFKGKSGKCFHGRVERPTFLQGAILNGNTHERALASQASSFHAAKMRNVLLKRVCGCSRAPDPVLDFSDSPSTSAAREVCCASQIAQEVSKLLRSAVRVCARDGFQFRCCSMAWLRAMLSCISLQS